MAGDSARRRTRERNREREEAQAGVTPPRRRAPRGRREGVPARGPPFAIPGTLARTWRISPVTWQARKPALSPFHPFPVFATIDRMKRITLRLALAAVLFTVAPARAAYTPAEQEAVRTAFARISSLIVENMNRIAAAGATSSSTPDLMRRMQADARAVDVSRCPSDFRDVYAELLSVQDQAVQLGVRALALQSLPREQSFAQVMQIAAELQNVKARALPRQVRLLNIAKSCGADVTALASGPWAEAAAKLAAGARPDPSQTLSPGTQRIVNRIADLDEAAQAKFADAADDLPARYAALCDYFVALRRINATDAPAAVRTAFAEYLESVRAFGSSLKPIIDAVKGGKSPDDPSLASQVEASVAAEEAVDAANRKLIEAVRSVGADPSPLESH